MVSRQQHILISIALLAAVAAIAADPQAAARAGTVVASKKKFLADDPLWAEPKPRPVHDLKSIKIDYLYDLVEQSFVTPHKIKPTEKARTPAQNINTIGEVPDSEWYTNRRGMSLTEVARGPGDTTPPDPGGAWRVTSAKTDGVTPGFRIEDRKGNRYLLKLDPPDYPELASAADVIGSKIYYALGYNTPENYVVYFRRDQLSITDSSSFRDRTGKQRTLTAREIDQWLATQPRDSEGRYRALASRWIAGKPIGPFVFEGTRSDDPNDVVPHENRRELRGMRIFAAWLNDTDTKSINTLDSLETENGISFIKHYRIDWGASLGSDSLAPKDIRLGHDYMVSPKSDAVQAFTFGLYLPKWMRAHYPDIRGVGTFDYESFDPVNWRPNYPVTPFILMDDDDAFWAVKKVMAFSDAQLRAMVQTARFSDPRATDWVTECLIKRRDKIRDVWLAKDLALDNFRVQQSRLAFDDLAEKSGVASKRSLQVAWSAFDNSTGEKTALQPAGNSWTVPARAGEQTAYVEATIRAGGQSEVDVYLRRAEAGWAVVGIERKY